MIIKKSDSIEVREVGGANIEMYFSRSVIAQ